MRPNRTLFAGRTGCRFRCQYCFAKTRHYKRQPVFNETNSCDGVDIVYPACDSEFLLEPGWQSKLRNLAARITEYSVLRFSTKTAITEQWADDLAKIQDSLRKQGRGSLLVGISISTASRIGEIEPGTATFQQRLAGLQLLASRSIPVNVTLRPLLPFISSAEYSGIVGQTREFTRNYLLGSLYVFDGTPFFERYIEGRYRITRRRVQWLDGTPEWEIVESSDLLRSVAEKICAAGCRAYESDIELIAHMSSALSPLVPTC